MKTILVLMASVTILLGLLLLIPQEEQQHHLETRLTHDTIHPDDMTQDHNHPWMNNAWYRYVYNSTRDKNCYICSHMPLTAKHLTLYGTPAPLNEGLCIYGKAARGHCNNQTMRKLEKWICLGDPNVQNINVTATVGQEDPTYLMDLCTNITNTSEPNRYTYACEDKHWVNMSLSTPNITVLAVVTTYTFPLCVMFVNITKGATHYSLSGTCQYTLTVPTRTKKLYWVEGTGWWCQGYANQPQTYLAVPENYEGQCVPLMLSDHTFVITAGAARARTRRRRAIQPHDPIWGSDVPKEFKLWTTGQKVAHALFPGVGIGKHALRIETLNYRFGLFLNASCRVNNAQNEEIDALRLSTMQHRVALDMILAEKGGLCVLFNTTCCTYIPNNVHSTDMSDALNTLRELRRVQQQDYTHNTEDWLTWLFSGSWKSLLTKGLTFVGMLLLLLCLFSTCVLPCIRSMISKMFTVRVQAYIALSQVEQAQEKVQVEEDDF
ncbi:hypothetical protein ACER0C_003412 [Sarotherodon galilaeus]